MNIFFSEIQIPGSTNLKKYSFLSSGWHYDDVQNKLQFTLTFVCQIHPGLGDLCTAPVIGSCRQSFQLVHQLHHPPFKMDKSLLYDKVLLLINLHSRVLYIYILNKFSWVFVKVLI